MSSWVKLLNGQVALLVFLMTSISVLIADENAIPPDGIGSDVEIWLQGLQDNNNRVRREAFLKLCDKTFPIDGWLENESRVSDKHRSAIALWLIRMRKGSGNLTQRAELLRDFDALMNEDDSVLENYVADGKWEQLIDLLGLIEPTRRTAFLYANRRIDSMVAQAWRTGQESYVPRLLDLTMLPTRRIQTNRWWNALGMPKGWQLSETSTLPSVKIQQLESQNKIDEAINLAKKTLTLQQIEPVLLRSANWDKWLKLEKRVPIVGSGNLPHQQAVVLTMLGRLDEAHALLNNSPKDANVSLKYGAGLLALALDRTDEFDAFVESLSGAEAFEVLSSIGHVQAALSKVGLNDLTLDGVKEWLASRAFEVGSEPESRDGMPTTKDIALLDYAETLSQIGMHEQAGWIEDYVVQQVQKEEADVGVVLWKPVFKQWTTSASRERKRSRAIELWKDILIRNQRRAKKTNNPLNQPGNQGASEIGELFRDLYPEFPEASQTLFEYLLRAESGAQTEFHALSNEAQAVAVSNTLESMEELHAGRVPKGWKESNGLDSLQSYLLAKDANGIRPSSVAILEVCKLLDGIGETQQAFEIVSMIANDVNASMAKAAYLEKLGRLREACDLLEIEFGKSPNDMMLLTNLIECLAKLGRFSELERYQLQCLSSTAREWQDIEDRRRRINLPVRPEVQMILEQLWLREDQRIALILLNLQFQEEIKTDLKNIEKAAYYGRLQLLHYVKFNWQEPEFKRLSIYFSRGLKPLILEAIHLGNQSLADELFHIAHRCSPLDIDLAIDALPFAEKAFGKSFADKWFDLYYQPMLRHMQNFTDDTLIGNNTAWLAASCNRELEMARELSVKVVNSSPTSTYLDTLAEIEYRLGNVEKAIELSERCRKIEPLDNHHREQLQRFRSRKP